MSSPRPSGLPTFLRRLIGSSPSPTTRDQQHSTPENQWRLARQPHILRLERARKQAGAALEKAQAEMEAISRGQLQPEHLIPASAPPMGELIDGTELVMGIVDAQAAMLLRRIEGYRALCWQLDGRIAEARADVQQLSDWRVRANRLQNLLDRCRVAYEDTQLKLHAPQPALQELFEAIVCAPASREGRLLARWVQQQQQQLSRQTEGSANGSSSSGQTVLDFIQYLSRLIVAQHSLSSSYLQPIQLCTSRLVLEQLQPHLWNSFAKRDKKKDALFVRQQGWMRSVSPDQLGVEERFIPKTAAAASEGGGSGSGGDGPHLAAAAVLGEFCFLATPVDQLLCLYRAVGVVHSKASEVAKIPTSGIDADALLPLLVWSVVHAHLPNAFTALAYAKALSSREHIQSELGYYLACLEAACAYVIEARPPGEGGGDSARLSEGGEPSPQMERASGLELAVNREREALASFLQQERNVDDLIGALVL